MSYLTINEFRDRAHVTGTSNGNEFTTRSYVDNFSVTYPFVKVKDGASYKTNEFIEDTDIDIPIILPITPNFAHFCSVWTDINQEGESEASLPNSVDIWCSSNPTVEVIAPITEDSPNPPITWPTNYSPGTVTKTEKSSNIYTITLTPNWYKEEPKGGEAILNDPAFHCQGTVRITSGVNTLDIGILGRYKSNTNNGPQ